jgi:trehalose 2-sulfotransferase
VSVLPEGDARSAIRRSYVICATPRTGSNLLCEVLQATGVAGRPDEYFWNLPLGHEQWVVSEFRAYVERILRAGTMSNGVFGVKVMWGYFGDLLPRLAALVGREDASPPEILAAVFPNLSYIWLTRRDKVRQGISWYRALATQRWRSTDPGDGSTSPPDFDFEAIDQLVATSIADDLAWQRFFQQHGVDPLHVLYEDLERDPNVIAERICHYLGLEPPAQPAQRESRHQQQSDDLTEEWIRRYHALKASIAD